MPGRIGWPDLLILGVWAIVLPRAKCLELVETMKKESPVELRLLPPILRQQAEHVSIQVQAALKPPTRAGKIWMLLEARWTN